MPFKKFDRSKLNILPLEQRIHDVKLEDVLLKIDGEIPEFDHPALDILADAIVKARRDHDATVLMMYGAHVIRTGNGLFMIELMKNSPKSLRVWKKYKVPRGFSNYLYNFGTYQLTGYTAHPSVPYVAEDARRIVEYGIRSIYRCGYGEKFGMEGPVSYVFNRLLDDPSLKPDRLMEEFCARAFGPAGTSMKRFYDILDKKLRGVNKMREGFESPGDSVAAIQAQTGNPNELMAYVYSTDTMRSMETLLRRSERAAGLTAKQIASNFGYANEFSLLRFVKNKTGKTFGDFRIEEKQRK